MAPVFNPVLGLVLGARMGSETTPKLVQHMIKCD